MTSGDPVSESRLGAQAWVRLLARAFLIAVVIVGVVSYVVFCPKVAGRFFSHVLFFPHPPDALFAIDKIGGVKKEDVFFTGADGKKLNGWLFRQNDQSPIVLFLHGNAGHIAHRAGHIQGLIEAGASVFIFDYRGYGRSEGSPTLSGVVEDAEAAFAYLKDGQHVASEKIVLYGESIGSGLACHLALRHPVRGLILVSPFTSLLAMAREKVPVMGVYPDFLASEPALDNLSYLKGPHPPLLIIHGARDNIIPLADGRQLFASASEPKRLVVLPASDHNNLGPDAALYAGALKSFISGSGDDKRTFR